MLVAEFTLPSPEEREAKIKELREKREAFRKELESLPPEERKARMEEMRSKFRDKMGNRPRRGGDGQE